MVVHAIRRTRHAWHASRSKIALGKGAQPVLAAPVGFNKSMLSPQTPALPRPGPCPGPGPEPDSGPDSSPGPVPVPVPVPGPGPGGPGPDSDRDGL